MGCGDFDHTYGNHDIYTKVEYLSPEECQRMHDRYVDNSIIK